MTFHHTTFNMRHAKTVDGFLNIVAPLIIGSLPYWLNPLFIRSTFFTSYWADFFWSYAFLSALLIIWDRKLKIHWLLISFFTCLLFEFLQFTFIIAGTGDWLDIIVYATGFLSALFINKLVAKNKAYILQPYTTQ